MQDSVKQDRQKFIGGSDIPIIMGISPFKKRWELLQEKAGIIEPKEVSNIYIDYGNVMESKIRDYINDERYEQGMFLFAEGKHVEEGDIIGFREHTDGENPDTVLEVKTTGGEIPWMVYEVQLLWYVYRTKKQYGMLAVYLRPEDMSEKFDPDRLTTKHYDIEDPVYANLLAQIKRSVDSFIEDLQALKENPFLTEEDMLPSDLVAISQKVVEFENRLKAIKAEEKAIKEQKDKLYDAMVKADVKSWQTINGYKITRVEAIPDSEKEIEEFDEGLFKEQHPKLYQQYIKTLLITVSGKKGYVKITPSKEK